MDQATALLQSGVLVIRLATGEPDCDTLVVIAEVILFLFCGHSMLELLCVWTGICVLTGKFLFCFVLEVRLKLMQFVKVTQFTHLMLANWKGILHFLGQTRKYLQSNF